MKADVKKTATAQSGATGFSGMTNTRLIHANIDYDS